MMNFLQDSKQLLSSMKKQEKQLIHKRRWLLGLPTSGCKRKNKKELNFLESRSIPELLVREDDVFPEILRKLIEKGFGLCSTGVGSLLCFDNSSESINSRETVKFSLSSLDGLTNIGLYKIASILTSGSLKFEKTRKKMKKLITESLSTISENKSVDQCQSSALLKISRLLVDRTNLKNKTTTNLKHHAPIVFHHATVTKVLDTLEDLPFETLSAMHRKLSGISGFSPKLLSPKPGWTRERLVRRIRKISLKMLSRLVEGDGLELQEPLAKALAVSQLSLRLTSGNRIPTLEFYNISPGREVLQNDIIKAILLLNGRSLTASDLKSLQHVLDPDSKVSKRSLRSAIRKMLTEYLFECGDMERIPDSLIQALNVISRRSGKPGLFGVSDKEIDREVEAVLSIGADLKQILWDWLSNCRLDEDYCDVYLDDPDVIEDLSSDDSNDPRGLDLENDSTEQSEFVGESDNFSCFHQETDSFLRSENGFGDGNLKSPNDQQGAKSDDDPVFNTNGKENIFLSREENLCRGKYVALQEICDIASVIAYRLIGNTLAYFAKEEGRNNDIYAESYLRFPFEEQTTPLKDVDEEEHSGKDNCNYDNYRSVEELIASFPQSKGDKIKELLGI